MAPTEITIQLNGQSHSLEACSLETLMQQFELSTTHGVAACVNDDVVAPSQWKDYLIGDADIIEVVHATQGG